MDFRQFVEARLGSFVYTVPKDKEEQMYDFYMLSLLKGSGDPDIASAVNHAREVLLPALRRNMLDALFFAICAELRHTKYETHNPIHHIGDDRLYQIYNKYSRQYDKERATRKKAEKPYEGERTDYYQSYKAANDTGIPRRDIVKMAEAVYRELEWSSEYGGKLWGDIADGWLKLNDAHSLRDMQVWIDHVYDLQHNNDTVFNKLRSYYKKGWSWIKKALDHKARIKSGYELMDKVSGPMKKLAGFALHAKSRQAAGVPGIGWGTSLEYFKKQRGKQIESLFSRIMHPSTGKVRIRYDDGRTIDYDGSDLKQFVRDVFNGDFEEGFIRFMQRNSVFPGDAEELVEKLGITATHKFNSRTFSDLIRQEINKFVRENWAEIKRAIDKYKKGNETTLLPSEIDSILLEKFKLAPYFLKEVRSVVILVLNRLEQGGRECNPKDTEIHYSDKSRRGRGRGFISLCIPTKYTGLKEPIEISITASKMQSIQDDLKYDPFKAKEQLVRTFPDLGRQGIDALLKFIGRE